MCFVWSLEQSEGCCTQGDLISLSPVPSLSFPVSHSVPQSLSLTLHHILPLSCWLSLCNFSLSVIFQYNKNSLTFCLFFFPPYLSHFTCMCMCACACPPRPQNNNCVSFATYTYTHTHTEPSPIGECKSTWKIEKYFQNPRPINPLPPTTHDNHQQQQPNNNNDSWDFLTLIIRFVVQVFCLFTAPNNNNNHNDYDKNSQTHWE